MTNTTRFIRTAVIGLAILAATMLLILPIEHRTALMLLVLICSLGALVSAMCDVWEGYKRGDDDEN